MKHKPGTAIYKYVDREFTITFQSDHLLIVVQGKSRGGSYNKVKKLFYRLLRDLNYPIIPLSHGVPAPMKREITHMEALYFDKS